MGFCCATSPVLAGAIRTRKRPLSRVFVGFNRQYVRSGHYGEVHDFFIVVREHVRPVRFRQKRKSVLESLELDAAPASIKSAN